MIHATPTPALGRVVVVTALPGSSGQFGMVVLPEDAQSDPEGIEAEEHTGHNMSNQRSHV